MPETSMTTTLPAATPFATGTTPRRPKIHMHPAKRRLLLVLALGSVLGCVLVAATLRLIVAPSNRWSVSSHDAMIQLQRLDADVARLRNVTTVSSQRMKTFLTQLQKLHAAAAARTSLVEKAAAQSYREHARDRLREHTMAIKEGILLQTSQRRRIDDARNELRQMNLTAELIALHMDPDASLEDQAKALAPVNRSTLSASSNLAKSIHDIRIAMLEHSVEAQNVSMNEVVSQARSSIADNLTQASVVGTQQEQNEHGLFVYVAVFGVIGVWLWSILTDERARKASVVFMTHRVLLRALGNYVVVEREDDSTDEDDV